MTTPKLTLPIQIGRKYVRRDGVVITARERHATIDDGLVYVGGRATASAMANEHAFTQNGRIHFRTEQNPLDLVADHIEQNTTAPAQAPAGPHPYAHILRAIADGQPVQWQGGAGRWSDQSASDTLAEIADKQYALGRYRVKPRTITINGHEVPEPLRDAPKAGTRYWTPFLASVNYTDQIVWTDDQYDARMLDRGLVHLTPEAAQAHAEALLSFTTTA